MIDLNLVTGKKSQDHITSDDFRKMIESLVGGGGSYVTSVGDELETTISGTNLYIGKGMIIHRGCVYETSNSGDTVAFQPGQSGMNRIDLVCVHYTRNNTTGIENAVWQVIQGTSTSGTPTAPSVPSGDLREDSATDDYCAVFKITHTGTSPTVTLLLQDIPMDGAYHKPASGIPKTDLAFNPIQMDLLWTNPNPTNAYAGGIESSSGLSDLSAYSMVMIQFRISSSATYFVNEFCQVQNASVAYEDLIKTQVGASDTDSSGFYESARWFYAKTNGVGFTDGYYKYYTSGTADWTAYNTLMIPQRVYGIKGVS